MAGRGGYRKPTNPAPVSGPGAHSQRTDGKQPIMTPTGMPYGAAQELEQLQAGAPLPQQGPLSTAQPVSLQSLTQGLTPLTAPTTDPTQPVTDGAAAGAGRGPAALGIVGGAQADTADFKKYLPVFIERAQADDAPQSFKNMVRQLIASL